MIPNKIKGYMQKLLDNGFDAYIIGGAVRDYLLKLTPDDYDIFTNATGEEILKIFPKGKVIGGEDRQKKILTVIVEGVEISQFRSNGDRTKTGSSLKEHQSTCDFTINAMAMDIKGKVIDEHNGIQDIDVKNLCFVGVPKERIKEDPLRILRGIRFWSKYRGMRFEDINEVIANIDLLDTLPKERIRDELFKIIKYPEGIENLWCDGIIYKIFPEFKEVIKMEGGDFHNEKVHNHMLLAFKEACKITDNTLLRLAIFLHDIGKGVTQTFEEDGKQTHFYRHENIGGDMMAKRLTELKFGKDKVNYITTLIYTHMYSYKVNPSRKSYIKFFNKLEEAKIPIEDYIMLIYCDHQSNLAKPRIKFGDFIKGNWLYKKYYEIKYSEVPMQIKDLKISGIDVMKYRIKGKDIGDVLKRAFEGVMEGEIKNERGELLNNLKEWLQ